MLYVLIHMCSNIFISRSYVSPSSSVVLLVVIPGHYASPSPGVNILYHISKQAHNNIQVCISNHLTLIFYRNILYHLLNSFGPE